jgi:hypothetical protein
MDPEIDRLWSAVQARWSDDRAHTAFIEYCRVTQQLGAAAARYKVEAHVPGPAYRTDGDRTEAAKKRLGAIAALAMAEVDRARLDREDAPRSPRAMRFLASMILLAVLALAALLLTR